MKTKIFALNKKQFNKFKNKIIKFKLKKTDSCKFVDNIKYRLIKKLTTHYYKDNQFDHTTVVTPEDRFMMEHMNLYFKTSFLACIETPPKSNSVNYYVKLYIDKQPTKIYDKIIVKIEFEKLKNLIINHNSYCQMDVQL